MPKGGGSLSCSWEAGGGRGGQDCLVCTDEHSEPQAAFEHQVGSLLVRTGLGTCRLSQSWRVSACLPLQLESCG